MSNELFLQWDDHHSLFFNAVEQLCQGDFLTDVTLSCGNTNFSAHKLVLSVCSGYFAKLFASRRSPPFTQTVVYLKDVDPKQLELILRYMYRGEISLNEEDLLTLLDTAKGLQVKGLTEAEDEEKPISRPKTPDGKRKPLVVKSKDTSGPDAKKIKIEDSWTGAQQDSEQMAAGAMVIQQTENKEYEEGYTHYTTNRIEESVEEEAMAEPNVPRLQTGLNEKTGVIEENPNQCKICGQVFSIKTNVTRHMIVHSDERPWKCFYCDYATNFREALKDHCIRKHKMNVEDFKNKALAAFPQKPRGRPKKHKE